MTQPAKEPIAILGIGCRFPGGADSPNAFWELLRNGADAIVDVPADRWSLRRFYDPNPDKPGKIYVRQGGFLQEKIDLFDAAFFGLTPREAVRLDPQQRVLMEVTWEALEDAGLVLDQARGSNTGVYIGAFTMDNMGQQFGVFNRDLIATHTSVSATMVMLSNRLSYLFDLHGPSLSLDTACSSSLVALHVACQALWNGECDMAISGGVNIMFRPEFVITMCKGHFLSPEARCKAFDESADGYVRGEGAAVVLLKPLSKALADGDPIQAVILATGINQDGRTQGITLPNGEAQEKLMRDVCQQAGILPEQVQYVEAHGTGTKAGDPIEAESLGRVFGRPGGEKCWIGSVKTNIGHLEAAAGISSVVKAILMLKHKQIPPHLHLKNVNSRIDLDKLGLRIPQQLEPWPEHEGPAYIGINSFGYGGTNAHVILSEAPLSNSPTLLESSFPLVVPLSAHVEEALPALAESHAQLLGTDIPLADYLYTVSRRRTHHAHRMAVIFNSRDDLRDKLLAFSKNEPAAVVGTAHQKKKLVFVYTGMGPQWWGMGMELMQAEPVFRAVIQNCDRIFTRFADWSICELFEQNTGDPMPDPMHAQPANFAIQVALTALWRSYGIEPDAVVGHSAGEIAAAYVGGSLTLEDALLVTYHRCRLMQRTVGQGKMLAAGLSLEEAQSLLDGYEEKISLAAVNSATSVTLAGHPEALQEIAAHLEQQGTFNRFLRLEVAYHSYQMDPLHDEFRNSLHNLEAYTPHLPLYSTVTGERVRSGEQDAGYWWRNSRQGVQLHSALKAIIDDGYDTFLEIGPQPVLAASIQETLRDKNVAGQSFHTLKRGQPERETLLINLGGLYTHGCDPDWSQIYPAGSLVTLPNYPWQRESLWVENEVSRMDRIGDIWHPILQTKLPAPQPTWEGKLSDYYLDYLRDHQIEGNPIFPAAGYVEMGLAAAGEAPVTLENLDLNKAILLHGYPIIQARVAEGRLSVYSRAAESYDEWTFHAAVDLLSKPLDPRVQRLNLSEIHARCGRVISAENLYQQLKDHKLEYGRYFRGVQQVYEGHGEVLAEVAVHEDLLPDLPEYRLHPSLLDSCFQTLILTLDAEKNQAVFMPVYIRQVRWHQTPGARVWCYTRLTHHTPRTIEGDVLLCDEDGRVLVEVYGLRLQRLVSGKDDIAAENWLYELRWEKQENPFIPAEQGYRWLIFSDSGQVADKLSRLLGERGAQSITVAPADSFSRRDLERLLESVSSHTPLGIIYLSGLDMDAHPEDDLKLTGMTDGAALMNLVQSLHAIDEYQSHKLVLVTSGAQQVMPEEMVSTPGQMVLWGMGRVIVNEHATLDARMVDLDPANPERSLVQLVDEVLHDNHEPEVVFRGDERYVHRLFAVEEETQPPIIAGPDTGFALQVARPGIIDSLEFHEVERRAPQVGEVEVRVQASALNFKDLMKVMNLLPDSYLENTFYSDAIGLECAGEVVSVGEGVTEFRVGDAVIVFNPLGSFQSYITLSAQHVIPRPSTLSFAESVVFINFVTAYYSLKEVARLRGGEKVLIHSATGGVGLAAIQVAQLLGAEVYATAGTEEKRAYLRALGIEYVSDSRSLKFVDDILAWTDGVDVVLNTLSGEALAKSFNLLAPYGRFIEIGKRDINENSKLAMAAFDRNLMFVAVDLDRMLFERPELFQDALKEVSQHFELGTLKPLPTKTFPAAGVTDAFRRMAQAKHIGKITVQIADQPVQVRPLEKNKPVIHPEGTYMVTGGFSGLGLEVAKWMVREGARNLVLVGRSGASTEEARAALHEFESQGVKVWEAKTDIANAAQVAVLLLELQQRMPPLRGIVHSAMVLEDDVLIYLNEERFNQVLAPKILGAWYLHLLTKETPLDFFVLFSSVSSYIGNPRQANYVAANAFLDGLAYYRRSRGLVGQSLNWGSISKVGAVARNPKVEQYLQQLGMEGLEPEMAAEVMGQLIHRNPVQISVMNMNWQKWANSSMNVTRAPLYTHLVSAYANQQVSSKVFVGHLLAAEPEALEKVAQDFLLAQLSKVTRIPAARLDVNLRLDQLGIDSLMGVELNNLIRMEADVDFSVMTLMQGLTIAQLASHLLEKMMATNPALRIKFNRIYAEQPGLLHFEVN